MELRNDFKNSDLGTIPEDWQTCPIGELEPFVTSGSRGWAGFYSDQGSPFVRITNLSRSSVYLDLKDLRFVHLPPNHSEAARTELQDGDILISITADIGIIGFVTGKLPKPAYINQHIALIRINSARANARFVSYFLASGRTQRIFRAMTDSGAKAGMNLATVQQITTAIPPTVAEQEAIAEALTDADTLIESLEQLLAKKRLLKQGAMQELLSGKRRLPGFDGKWRRCQLGDVISECGSGATPYRGNPDFYKGTVKWITSGELNYNLISDTLEHISANAVKQTNLRMHPPGTFLMAITGLEAAGTRGACGIVGAEATTNQSCMAIYPTAELRTEYLYHYYVLNGNKLALEYCQGTKQQSYTAKIVRLLPIELPPTVTEQRAIAAILSDIDAEIAAVETRLIKARHLKQAMMQELLTGRIRLVKCDPK